MYIKSFNKTTKEQRKQIETPCNQVYLKEGEHIGVQMANYMRLRNRKIDVGLSHNQVGGNKSVFVARLSCTSWKYEMYDSEKPLSMSSFKNNGKKWRVFVNPTITHHSKGILADVHNGEGCLSFPDKFTESTNRWSWVVVKHQIRARNTLDGKLMFIEEKFQNYDSRIVQHEIDHLNGIHIFNKEEIVSRNPSSQLGTFNKENTK